jgi:bacterioferritin
MITLLGEYPSLTIGPLLDSHQHGVDAIMRESLESEAKALALYRELLKCAEGRSVMIEEYARQMVYAEDFTQAKSTRCSASLAKSPPSVLFEHPPENPT